MIFRLVIVDKGRPTCWNVRCIIFRQRFLSIPSSFIRYPVNSVWFSHACKYATNAVWQILLLSEGSCMHSHSRGKAPDTICSFLPHYLSLFTPFILILLPSLQRPSIQQSVSLLSFSCTLNLSIPNQYFLYFTIKGRKKSENPKDRLWFELDKALPFVCVCSCKRTLVICCVVTNMLLWQMQSHFDSWYASISLICNFEHSFNVGFFGIIS